MSGQAAFRAGLLDPDQPAPSGLQDGAGRVAGRRYDVYRNNVTVSLIDAMQAAFPLVAKLIGPQRFHISASAYVRAHPPSSPVMMFYGDDFPVFLQTFPLLASLGFLPDAARLDLALRQSYHAADSVPLNPKVLEDLAPEPLMNSRFRLAPATRILRSRWPLYDIWAFNQPGGAEKPRDAAQNVLITRPGFDPIPHPMPPGCATWLLALADGLPFGAAHDAATTATADFDLAESLGFALQTQAFSEIY